MSDQLNPQVTLSTLTSLGTKSLNYIEDRRPVDYVPRTKVGINQGEKNAHAKITEEEAIAILEECYFADTLRKFLKDYSVKAIAKRHGLGTQTVQDLKMGTTWRHLHRYRNRT